MSARILSIVTQMIIPFHLMLVTFIFVAKLSLQRLLTDSCKFLLLNSNFIF